MNAVCLELPGLIICGIDDVHEYKWDDIQITASLKDSNKSKLTHYNNVGF